MTAADEWLEVESLDLEAQGVAHNAEGKVVFIEGALPTERVQVQVHRRKNNWEQASLTATARESSQRVRPACPHFGLHAGACGGCKMQHLHPSAQVAVKQRTLEDNLWHLGKVKAGDRMLRPIEGPAWGYRYRARLVGAATWRRRARCWSAFTNARARYIADMQSVRRCCRRGSAALLLPLRDLVMSMDGARDAAADRTGDGRCS